MSPQTLAVSLPDWEGPLDLLLHVIRSHKLDILDIPISFVTQQYLEYLDTMRALNLDIAGEYLEMAATLAYIKSKMMLPVSNVLEEEESGRRQFRFADRPCAHQSHRPRRPAAGRFR